MWAKTNRVRNSVPSPFLHSLSAGSEYRGEEFMRRRSRRFSHRLAERGNPRLVGMRWDGGAWRKSQTLAKRSRPVAIQSSAESTSGAMRH